MIFGMLPLGKLHNDKLVTGVINFVNKSDEDMFKGGKTYLFFLWRGHMKSIR